MRGILRGPCIREPYRASLTASEHQCRWNVPRVHDVYSTHTILLSFPFPSPRLPLSDSWMFTGARDFSVGRLGIISAGRDVNINVINAPGPPSQTLDLQALFTGVLNAEREPGELSEGSSHGSPSDGDVFVAQAGRNSRRGPGFKRALYGVFGKLKGKKLKGETEGTQVPGVEVPPIAEISTAEVYVRGLLESGNGLPCWNPKPYGLEGDGDGTSPGDVGIYTAERGFEKLFNLWDDEPGIQAVAESLGGEPYRPPKRTVLVRRNRFEQGEIVAQGVDAQPLPSANEATPLGFQFNTQSTSDGAILALTSSADLESLEDLTVLHLRECMIQHAGVLYIYANRVRRLQAEDSSLYVVTGCVKSDSWALGAFRRPLQGGTLRLERGASTSERSVTPVYQWNRAGSIWADLFTGRSPEGRKNHSLFLRGFKIGFSPAFRYRIARSEQSGALIPSTQHSTGNTYHPCDIINHRMLLETGVDIALSHDDNWRFLFKEMAGQNGLLSLESFDFKQHAKSSKNLKISIRNGVAYIESSEFGEEEDRIKQENRQKDLDRIIPRQPHSKAAVQFKTVPESELTFIRSPGVSQAIAHGVRSDFYLCNRKCGEKDVKVTIKISRSYMHHSVNKRRDGDALDELRLEYAVLSMLSHPNILRLEGLAKLDELPLHGMVLDYKPLGHIVGFARRNIPFNRMAMAKGIASGLEYIHDMQVVHGNLLPTKILVDMNAATGEFFPVICGFASSRILSWEDCPTNDPPGSGWYRAPEHLVVNEDLPSIPVTTEADVFSFALIVSEILTGRLPYTRGRQRPRLTNRLVDPTTAPWPASGNDTSIDPSYKFVWPILEACTKMEPSERLTSKEAHKRLCEVTA